MVSSVGENIELLATAANNVETCRDNLNFHSQSLVSSSTVFYNERDVKTTTWYGVPDLRNIKLRRFRVMSNSQVRLTIPSSWKWACSHQMSIWLIIFDVWIITCESSMTGQHSTVGKPPRIARMSFRFAATGKKRGLGRTSWPAAVPLWKLQTKALYVYRM